MSLVMRPLSLTLPHGGGGDQRPKAGALAEAGFFLPLPLWERAGERGSAGMEAGVSPFIYPQRWTRAVPPLARASTSSSLAMVVSPGKVVRSAPCAHPSLRASSGALPASSP